MNFLEKYKKNYSKIKEIRLKLDEYQSNFKQTLILTNID